MKFAPYCFCTVVTDKALKVLLDAPAGGAYKDNHPWLIAEELLRAAQARDEAVALLLACNELARNAPADSLSGGALEFSHWAVIDTIEVNRFRQGAESRVCFAKLHEVSELWAPLDSLMLMPAAERLRRETLEGLRPSRQCLDEHALHPYAICEAPPFLTLLARADDGQSG